jgi:hypothetical protein
MGKKVNEALFKREGAVINQQVLFMSKYKKGKELASRIGLSLPGLSSVVVSGIWGFLRVRGKRPAGEERREDPPCQRLPF